MTDTRSKLSAVLEIIENLPLETLQQYPELERIIPSLYDAIQIEDVCDHKFNDGICICGATK